MRPRQETRTPKASSRATDVSRVDSEPLYQGLRYPGTWSWLAKWREVRTILETRTDGPTIPRETDCERILLDALTRATRLTASNASAHSNGVRGTKGAYFSVLTVIADIK
jgi:hypothetical protein